MVSTKIKGKKEGQMIGQAFIFILAAILFSLILLFGYKAIARIGETQSEVELIEFKDGLSGAVNKISLDYGSVKKYPMKVPSDYKEIIFIDLDYLKQGDNKDKLDALGDEYPLIMDSVESGSEQNVFTIPIAKTPLTVGKIEIGDPEDLGYTGYLSIENKGGVINLRLEGMGDRARIGVWPSE